MLRGVKVEVGLATASAEGVVPDAPVGSTNGLLAGVGVAVSTLSLPLEPGVGVEVLNDSTRGGTSKVEVGEGSTPFVA